MAMGAWGADVDDGLQQRLQEEARRQVELSFRRLREIPNPFPMSAICRLRVEDGRWIITTKIPSGVADQPVRIKVQELPGTTILSIGAHEADRAPDTLQFQNICFTDAKAIQIRTSISVYFGSMSISRSIQRSNAFENVTLTQSSRIDDEAPQLQPSRSPVVLAIQSVNNRGRNQVDLRFMASDLSALRREHPREVDRYLRPLLRQLQLEPVLAVDDVTAWQVFSDELKPDPAVLALVESLLPALDSDVFQAREKAVQQLRRKGAAMALAVTRLDRSRLSDQQNASLDVAMAPFWPEETENIQRLRNDVDFLLDSLYSDDQAVRRAAFDCLQRRAGRRLSFDLDAASESRTAAIEILRREIDQDAGK
jgi:hypothetical protein